MQVRDIMTKAVVSVDSDTSVLDLAALMLDNRVSAIPVISGGLVAGIVSEADLLRRYELGTQREVMEKPWWTNLMPEGCWPERSSRPSLATAPDSELSIRQPR